MEILALILILFVVILNIALVVILMRKKGKNETDKPENGEMKLLLQYLNDLSRTMDEKIGRNTKETQESIKYQGEQSQKIIRDVTERLTKLDETNKQVLDFSDQLKQLQDTLTNPKHRGILGEYYLEETLRNVLSPNGYKMQYRFKNGEIVDAVVFVKEKIVPIDSKFPLENYQRLLEEKDPVQRGVIEKNFISDLKKRIDETSKYVRPTEDTTDFAFMFIPSEAMYYDLLVNRVGDTNLVEYAFRKHVVIVSPTSFLAYLQTVLQGLRAMQIEESAKEIRKNVETLSKHIGSYDTFLGKLGKHLGTTVSTYNLANQEFKKIDKDVVRISGKGGGVKAIEIEKPVVEE